MFFLLLIPCVCASLILLQSKLLVLLVPTTVAISVSDTSAILLQRLPADVYSKGEVAKAVEHALKVSCPNHSGPGES